MKVTNASYRCWAGICLIIAILAAPISYSQTLMSQTNPYVEQTGSAVALYWTQTGVSPVVRRDIQHINQSGFIFAGSGLMSSEMLVFQPSSWIPFYSRIIPLDMDANVYGTEVMIGPFYYSPGWLSIQGVLDADLPQQFFVTPSVTPLLSLPSYGSYSFSTFHTGPLLTLYSYEPVEYMISGSGLVSTYTGSIDGTGTIPIEFISGTTGSRTFAIEYMSGANGTGWDRYGYLAMIAQLDLIAPVITGANTGGVNAYQRSFTTSFVASEEIIDYELGGACSGYVSAVDDSNLVYTLSIKYLPNGNYSDCTLIPYDSARNTGNMINLPSFSINTTPSMSGSMTEDVLGLLLGASQKRIIINMSLSDVFSGYQEYLTSNDEQIVLDALQFSGSCAMIPGTLEMVNATNGTLAYYLNNVGVGTYSCEMRYHNILGQTSDRYTLTPFNANTSLVYNLTVNPLTITNTAGFHLIAGTVESGTDLTIAIMSGTTSLLQGVPSVVATSRSYQMPPVSWPADGYYTVIMTGSRTAYNPQGVLQPYSRVYELMSSLLVNGQGVNLTGVGAYSAGSTTTSLNLTGKYQQIGTGSLAISTGIRFSLAGGFTVALAPWTIISVGTGNASLDAYVFTGGMSGANIVNFGATGASLYFSKPIQIMYPLPAGYNGGSVDVSVKHRGDSNYGSVGLTLDPNVSCMGGSPISGSPVFTGKALISGTFAVIYSCRASAFQFVAPVTTSTTTSTSQGGGGGSRLSMDRCPGGDYSPSYYDNSCTVDGVPSHNAPSSSKQPLSSLSTSQMRQLVDTAFVKLQTAYKGKTNSRKFFLTRIISAIDRIVKEFQLEYDVSNQTERDILTKKIYVLNYLKARAQQEKNTLISKTTNSTTTTVGKSTTNTTTSHISLVGGVDRYELTVSKKTCKVNEAIDLTITAKQGTKVLSTATNTVLIDAVPFLTDEQWTRPNNGVYEFTPEDKGSKTFTQGLVFKKPGTYKIVVSDVLDDIQGQVQVTVTVTP